MGNSEAQVLVVGLGEIGRPLSEILSDTYDVVSKDLQPVAVSGPVDVMHVCYPYQIADFVGVTCDYISTYQPQLTVIHSTVLPGTTRRIHDRTHGSVVYSPVRGKHSKMKNDLLSYTKYVSGITSDMSDRAMLHLTKAGIKSSTAKSCEGLELAKLIETSYLGLLVGWAQEIERYCKCLSVEYSDAMELCQEVKFYPPVVFLPGYIGGHCVVPNLRLLSQIRESGFVDMILDSNEQKAHEWVQQGRSLSERLAPIPHDNNAKERESCPKR